MQPSVIFKLILIMFLSFKFAFIIINALTLQSSKGKPNIEQCWQYKQWVQHAGSG